MTEELQKEICGFQFTFVADIQPERTAPGEVRDCTPEGLSFYPDEAFNPYGKRRFCRFRVRGLGRQAGVYVLSIDDIIVYVGKCTNLAQRFGPRGYGVIHTANCFRNGQSTNCRLNHFIFKAASAGKRIRLWFHQTQAPDTAEARILPDKRPRLNKNHRSLTEQRTFPGSREEATMPDSRNQHRQVLEEMPIDGKSVNRGEQSWTIRVEYAFLEPNSSNRILKLRLEGEPVLKRTLIVAGELLITQGQLGLAG